MMSENNARRDTELACTRHRTGARCSRSPAYAQWRQNLKLARADISWWRPTPPCLAEPTGHPGDDAPSHDPAPLLLAPATNLGGRPKGPPKCAKCRRAKLPCGSECPQLSGQDTSMAVTGLPATSPAEAGSKDTGSTSTAAAATSSAEARSIHIGPNSLAATLAEGGQSAAVAAAMASIATPMRTAIDGMGASVEPVPTLDSARPTHRMLARRQDAAPTRFDEHVMQPLRCRTPGAEFGRPGSVFR